MIFLIIFLQKWSMAIVRMPPQLCPNCSIVLGSTPRPHPEASGSKELRELQELRERIEALNQSRSGEGVRLCMNTMARAELAKVFPGAKPPPR